MILDACSAAETQELPYYSDNSLHASRQHEVFRKRLESQQFPETPNPKPWNPKPPHRSPQTPQKLTRNPGLVSLNSGSYGRRCPANSIYRVLVPKV